jgi:hypothetical protein
MIGDEALEDAFGDFRTFYITFAKIFFYSARSSAAIAAHEPFANFYSVV